MEAFIERLQEEKSQLEDRLTKLNSFMSSDKFTEIKPFQRSALVIQSKAMGIYLDCLIERIKDLIEE